MSDHKIESFYRGVRVPEDLIVPVQGFRNFADGVNAVLDHQAEPVDLEEPLADWERELLEADGEKPLRAFKDDTGGIWFEVIPDGYRLSSIGGRSEAERLHAELPSIARRQSLSWVNKYFGPLTELNSDGSPKVRKFRWDDGAGFDYDVNTGELVYANWNGGGPANPDFWGLEDLERHSENPEDGLNEVTE